MNYKLDRGLEGRLSATNIIPCFNIAWNKLFTDTARCKKAIANRGWYSPTQNLLKDPRIKKPETPADGNEIQQEGLGNYVNLKEGKGIKIFSKIGWHM